MRHLTENRTSVCNTNESLSQNMKMSTAGRDVQQSFKVYTKKEVVSCKYHQKGFQQKWAIDTVFCITSEAGTKTNEMTAMRTRYLYNLKIIVLCCAQTSNTF